MRRLEVLTIALAITVLSLTLLALLLSSAGCQAIRVDLRATAPTGAVAGGGGKVCPAERPLSCCCSQEARSDEVRCVCDETL